MTRGFPPHTLDLKNLPYLGEPAEPQLPPEQPEGKEGGSDQPKRTSLLGRIGAQLGDRGPELYAPGNAAALRLLDRRLGELQAGGWTVDELVAEMTANLGRVGCVVAVVVDRAKKLPEMPLRLSIAVENAELDGARRRRQIEQARDHARLLAGAVDSSGRVPTPADLDESLRYHYESDPELLEAARAVVAPQPSAAVL